MNINQKASIIAFASQVQDEARRDNKELSLNELATMAIQFFDIKNLTQSQVYQLLYRNIKQNVNKPDYLSDLAKRIGTREEQGNPYRTPQEASKEWEGTGILKQLEGEYKKATTGPVKLFDNPTKFTTPGTYIVIGCAHAPAHNKELFKGIKQLIADQASNVAGLALIGDIVDCNTLSEYGKGKFTPIKGITLDDEYKSGKELVQSLVADLKPEAHKIYLYGNHEDRYNRYMSDMENSKRVLPSPEIGMELDKMDFRVYKRWSHDYVTLGNHLDLLHGQFFNVHCAKKHIDSYRGSVMFAHTHRIQTYIEGEVGGFNIGWTGDINSPFFDYMPRGTKQMWQNGFAVVNIDEKGEYYVTQVIAHNNRFYYGNKRY